MRSSLLPLLGAATLLLTACGGCAPKAERLDAPVTQQLEAPAADAAATFDHSAFDALLKKHVRFEAGRVDYAGLQADRAQLDAYLQRVAQAKLDTLSREEAMALLINAYNGYTLQLILEHYPNLKSIRDLEQPWDTARYVVGGQTVSLNNIEHNLLRPVYKDPRIHFAVNCASVGCPPLLNAAYTGAQLEAQLDAQARAFVANPRHVSLQGDTLTLSRILEWYGDDFKNPEFKGHAPTLPAYLAAFASPDLAPRLQANPSVTFSEYDWSLNDASGAP